jgi:regulator of sirC expression with transglutaminase-like and TPR domain
LERKRGLPITLSVVYCEVARRAGLEAVGINMPNHFLAQFRGRHSSVLVDPYNHGARLQTPEEWASFTKRILGRPVEITPDELPIASRRMILARILANLKMRYVQQQPPQLMKALAAVERILVITPTPEQVRDRGLILRAMGMHALERASQLHRVDRSAAARATNRAAQLLGPTWFDLKLYARLAEGTGDAKDIDRTANQIWKLLGRQN